MENAVAVETSVDPSRQLEGARIIIAIGDLQLGGAERQAVLLAEYLATEERAQVELWGLGAPDGPVARICEEKGIPWRVISAPWFCSRGDKVKNLARLTLALRKAKPDVILSYLIGPNVTCGLIWRWTGARSCIWNQRCTGIDRVGPKAERLAVSRVPWFATNSIGGSDFLVNTFGVSRERVRVIHNAIQVPAAPGDRFAAREHLGLDHDSFVACMVANLTKYKDHETAVRAWKIVIDRLESEGRSGQLLFAGRVTDADSSLDSLKILAFDLGLSRAIRFLGEVKDVSTVLAASDLSILSSRSESSPNAVLEAMAAGLPVAGSDNSGMREALGPEGHQFLAPAGDAPALAARIVRLAMDSCLRRNVGLANRVRIQQEFNAAQNCKQMASLIKESLQRAS